MVTLTAVEPLHVPAAPPDECLVAPGTRLLVFTDDLPVLLHPVGPEVRGTVGIPARTTAKPRRLRRAAARPPSARVYRKRVPHERGPARLALKGQLPQEFLAVPPFIVPRTVQGAHALPLRLQRPPADTARTVYLPHSRLHPSY